MYSQNREEEFILYHFNGKKDGTFLDIGANDGMTLSNTRRLVFMGWVGVCVEPDPVPFAKLNKLVQPNTVHCFNVAIGTQSGKMDFYQSGSHLKTGDSGLLSTLVKSEIDRWKGTEEFKPIQVDVLSWADFYAQCPIKTFDFISIDAEGMDVEILNQIDLEKTQTSLVCIEWNGVAKNRLMIEKKLRFKFRLIHKNFENLIYGK